jgi:hypothetical protein
MLHLYALYYVLVLVFMSLRLNLVPEKGPRNMV